MVTRSALGVVVAVVEENKCACFGFERVLDFEESDYYPVKFR